MVQDNRSRRGSTRIHLTGAEFLAWLRFAEGEELPVCTRRHACRRFHAAGISRDPGVRRHLCAAIDALNSQAGEVLDHPRAAAHPRAGREPSFERRHQPPGSRAVRRSKEGSLPAEAVRRLVDDGTSLTGLRVRIDHAKACRRTPGWRESRLRGKRRHAWSMCTAALGLGESRPCQELRSSRWMASKPRLERLSCTILEVPVNSFWPLRPSPLRGALDGQFEPVA